MTLTGAILPCNWVLFLLQLCLKVLLFVMEFSHFQDFYYVSIFRPPLPPQLTEMMLSALFFSYNCVLISSFPQIHPSPRDLKQLSVSFSSLLSDNHVCYDLHTTYHNAVCLCDYKQKPEDWCVSDFISSL